MPLVYQQNINDDAKIGVWKIEESEDFFLQTVHPQRSIHHHQKRLQHLAGRYLLKLMDDSINMHQMEVSINGRPFFPGDSCFFSISHSKDIVAVILSKHAPVGIDIELISERVQGVYDKFLSPHEQELLLKTMETKANAYTLGWTIKEALFKWEGKGMIDFKKHLQLASVSLHDGVIQSCCTVQKQATPIQLNVNSIMIENAVMSWVFY